MIERFHQVIVGAGLAGLSHAWWCAQRGQRVLVLEATDRVGGVRATQTTAGYRHEHVPLLVPSSATHVRALLADLPDAPALKPAAAQSVFVADRRGLVQVPRSPAALLRSALLPWSAKVRFAGELLRGPRRAAGGETLEAFVRRRFGGAFTRRVLPALTSALCGTSPDRLGAADAWPALVALERRRGSVLKACLPAWRRGAPTALALQGGSETLVQALGKALGDRVHLGARVTRLTPGSSGEPARAHLADGGIVAADEVTLALPARAQAALLRSAYPHVADELDAVGYVPLVTIAVGFRNHGHPPLPDGWGLLRGTDTQARVLAILLDSRIDPQTAPDGCALVTVLAGGSAARDLLDLEDDRIRNLALEDLAATLGGPIRPDMVDVHRRPRALPVFLPGHRGRMAQVGAELARARWRLHGTHMTGLGVEDLCRPAAALRAPLPAGLVRR